MRLALRQHALYFDTPEQNYHGYFDKLLCGSATCLGKVLHPTAINVSKIGTFADCNYGEGF